MVGTRTGARAATALGVAGLALVLVAVFDPTRTFGRYAGPLLAAAALLHDRRRTGILSSRYVVLVVLVTVLALGSLSAPQFHRADFPQYFCYLRSMVFDRDLDFANEWAHWGFPEQPVTPTGHRRIQGSIGPALFWSPFYLLAHGYVVLDRALGSGQWAADGFSLPYARATLAGTLTAALLGSFLLGSVIAARLDRTVAAIAVLAAAGASPVVFYLFVQPGMAHGLTYGLAGAGVWALDRAARDPSARSWALFGAVVGLLALVRPQAAAFALALAPLALRELWRRRLRPAFVVAAAAAAVAGFFPQMAAWKVIYGSWLTQSRELEQWAQASGVKQQVLFRMSSWFDPRSLHFWDTLFAADRGLFSWTPLVLLGTLGLVPALRRFGHLAAAGLLVFAATAWFNGAVATYRAGDSFGARRFDLVIPFVALGLAVLVHAARRWPLLAPTLVVGAAVLWNLGFIRLWNRNVFPAAAPLESLAAAQAGQAEDVAERVLGRLFGPRGRVFAYNALVGEYMYWNLGDEGHYELGNPALRYLAGGWSAAVNRTGPPQYRTAFHPQACLRFPLMAAVGMKATVTAKRPGRLAAQQVTLRLNGRPGGAQPLGPEWDDLVFETPRDHAVAGENTLCLEFSEGAEKGRDGERIAAHVRRIVVDSKTPSWPSPIWHLAREGR
jgi:hypothetical protein